MAAHAADKSAAAADMAAAETAAHAADTAAPAADRAAPAADTSATAAQTSTWYLFNTMMKGHCSDSQFEFLAQKWSKIALQKKSLFEGLCKPSCCKYCGS